MDISISSLSSQAAALSRPGSHSGFQKSARGRVGSGSPRASLWLSLLRATTRELVWGLRLVSQEVDRWHARAARIPDPELRANALEALKRKRGNINGAALFWSLPDRRNRELLSVLVAYEILADYLDCVNERSAELGIDNGRQLQLALSEALDVEGGISDYYSHHRCRRDGGYLQELVRSCQAGCERLPCYEQVKPFLMRAARMSPVLGLNHEPNATRRDRVLQDWALLHPREAPPMQSKPAARDQLSWYEQTAGSSAWLTVLAMLALTTQADERDARQSEVQVTYDAYLQWISTTGAMLDSYGDINEDRANGDHSYIGHYPSIDVAVDRLSELIRRSRVEAHALPGGSRHSVIVACMVAFYLSKDSVCTPEMLASTRRLRSAGGPLVQWLIPVLRLWRTVYGQRAM